MSAERGGGGTFAFLDVSKNGDVPLAFSEDELQYFGRLSISNLQIATKI